jgi:hypothetical protein
LPKRIKWRTPPQRSRQCGAQQKGPLSMSGPFCFAPHCRLRCGCVLHLMRLGKRDVAWAMASGKPLQVQGLALLKTGQAGKYSACICRMFDALTPASYNPSSSC